MQLLCLDLFSGPPLPKLTVFAGLPAALCQILLRLHSSYEGTGSHAYERAVEDDSVAWTTIVFCASQIF